ncbi:MAG: hypothetical protein JO328_04835 [Hyphomicrobiales bacterium]|nr:hypothetical protein [Hyphomicrobiales bacterium]MBV8825551.1 hypothetical protein [Hyphomicrobiales bacterium]MBV9430128.1 hypothetical protein [Bradyrhizobiaceae bacterium]
MSARVGIEVDRVCLSAADIIDELTIAAGEIDDDPVFADERLEKARAQQFPDARFASSLGLTKAEPVKLREIEHRVGRLRHAPAEGDRLV